MGGEIDLPQLHFHDAIGATNQPQLDHLIAGLSRGAIGQPDAIFVAILRRQYEIEQATDREARIVLQAQSGIRGIGVGVECCVFAKEGVSCRRSCPEAGVAAVHVGVAAGFGDGASHGIGGYRAET